MPSQTISFPIATGLDQKILYRCKQQRSAKLFTVNTTQQLYFLLLMLNYIFTAALQKNKIIPQPVTAKDFQDGMTQAIRNGKQRKRNMSKKRESGENAENSGNEPNKRKRMSDNEFEKFMNTD